MRRFNLMLLALCLVSGLTTIPAFAAPEENGAQRCSDGRDNDGDGLIDGDDPDCGGGGTGGAVTTVLIENLDGPSVITQGVIDLNTGTVCKGSDTSCPPGFHIRNTAGSQLHAHYTLDGGNLKTRALRGIPFHEVTLEVVEQVGPNEAQYIVNIRFNDTLVVDTGDGIYKIGFAQCLIPFGDYLPTPMPWCEDTWPPIQRIVLSYARLD